MAVVRRRTTKAEKAGHDSELARISALVEQMKQDWDSQKQALEQKIDNLETELTQTRKLAQVRAEQTSEEIQTTSRRWMLKRLGVAAAGLAVASVAATGVAPEAAEAAPFSMLLNDGTAAGPDGVLNTTSGTSTIAGQSSGATSGMVLQVKNLFPSVVTPTASNPNPNDAIVASSAQGIAVNGTTLGGSSNSGVQGIQGSSTNIQAAATTQVTIGSKGAGVIGLSDTNNGVNGFSAQGNGVLGFSSGNYGVVAQVGVNAGNTAITGSAPLLIVPEPQTGGPSVGAHVKGELHVDAGADMYICTVGGSPAPLPQSVIDRRYPHADAQDKARMAAGAGAQFTKFLTSVGSPPGLAIYLPIPLRLVGPNNTNYTAFPPIPASSNVSPNPTYFPISGITVTNNNPTGVVTGSIPANASGVVGTLTILSALAFGFITVYPADLSSPPFVASTVYPAATAVPAVSTNVVVKLGSIPGGPPNQKGIAVVSNVACQIGFDVTAYIT